MPTIVAGIQSVLICTPKPIHAAFSGMCGPSISLISSAAGIMGNQNDFDSIITFNNRMENSSMAEELRARHACLARSASMCGMTVSEIGTDSYKMNVLHFLTWFR